MKTQIFNSFYLSQSVEHRSSLNTNENNIATSLCVAIIILNLDGKYHIQKLLRSLRYSHHDFFELEIIVVDNGSSDGSIPVIQHELNKFSSSHLIRNENNLGAAEGRNQALRHLLNSNFSRKPKYILTLDNDTTVDPDVITDLVRRAETSSPEEIVFAPLVYFANNPERRWANWWIEGWRFPVQLEADWKLRHQYNNGNTVDGIATAIALFKSSAFVEIGHFDSRLFFGYEDAEWFQRARQKKFEIKLVPVRGKVLHDCHQSLGGSEKGTLSPPRVYYVIRNMLLMLTLFKKSKRSNYFQFVKVGGHICLYSFRTLCSLNWLGLKALLFGLYDGLLRRSGIGWGEKLHHTTKA